MGSFSLPKDVLEAEIDLTIATRPERDPYHLKNRSPVVRVLPVNPEDKETFESLMTYIGPRILAEKSKPLDGFGLNHPLWLECRWVEGEPCLLGELLSFASRLGTAGVGRDGG
jgi:hypothetical protein